MWVKKEEKDGKKVKGSQEKEIKEKTSKKIMKKNQEARSTYFKEKTDARWLARAMR